MKKVFYSFLIISLVMCNMILAEDSPYRTPRAGEAYQDPVTGMEVSAFDRTFVKSFTIGLIHGTPNVDSSPFPFFAFFYNRNTQENLRRLAIIAAGIFDVLDFGDSTWNKQGWEYSFTFENSTPPYTSALLYNGETWKRSELYWGYVRFGLGFGLRKLLNPKLYDNDFKLTLYYEPGYLYTKKTDKTDPHLIIPPSTYEHRVHLKIRLDYFERNVLELKHQGLAIGSDLIYGQRMTWKDHGFYLQNKKSDTQNYWYVKGFINMGLGVPGLSERHRLLPTLYGAYSPCKLDRYASLTLGGAPTYEDARSLDLPILYGTMPDEFVTHKYILGTITYRLEILFFLFYEIRYTTGLMTYQSVKDKDFLDITNAEIQYIKSKIRTISTALSSGFLWNSMIVLEYAYNFEVKRKDKKGGYTFLFNFMKQF